MKKDADIWKRISHGIKDGRKAFCGPHTVQIDLTDKCNSTCIGCWVHSPLIDKREVFPKGHKELDFKLVEKLINQLHSLGTREIILSGSGEPFLYPKIEKIIKIIKSKGMYLNIITNATLLDETIATILVRYKVDLITASVWAGDHIAYSATHPGKTVKDFGTVKKNLTRLASCKKKRNSLIPHLKLYNVICNKNYTDIENMIEFAKHVDGDSVEFQAIDTIQGKTDRLSLSQSQINELVSIFEKISDRKDFIRSEIKDMDGFLHAKNDIEEQDFGKLWKNYKEGFTVLEKAKNIVCPEGNLCRKGERLSVKTSSAHSQDAVFKFFFETEKCEVCNNLSSCFPFKKCFVDVNVLNILGVRSFTRKVLSSNVDETCGKQIDAIPCYIGWYYARILTDGSVIPCCKAAKFSLGNLYDNDFNTIWHLPLYEEFRFNAKNLTKRDPYFSKLNCIKSCDNWGMNLEIHKKFSQPENIKPDRSFIKHTITIKAKDFIKGNINATGEHDFGNDIIIDGGKKSGYAEYKIVVARSGAYGLYSRYACNVFRPVDIYLDNELVKKDGLGFLTGGWTSQYLMWNKEANINLEKGEHTLKIQSAGPIPHIEKFMVTNERNPACISGGRNSFSYLSSVKKVILRDGIKEAMKKVKRNLKVRYLKDRYLEILGIYDKTYGYKGPFHVQIDLTNNCNNECIACWCNSPLFKVPRLSQEEKEQFLPLEMVRELLDDISSMGATEVYFSGSGEPFMHPHIMEILTYAKSKNVICHVNTNFTLLDKKKLDRLIDIGVDFLTVSTWAATAMTYIKTHANRTEADFNKIRENLIYLNTNKKDKPRVKLYNVIFNMNYFEVEKMVDFAEATKSESLEFTLVDIMPNSTDVLILDKQQLAQLSHLCMGIQSRLNAQGRTKDTNVLIFQFEQFLRRISVSSDVFDAKYDRNIIDSMPCYIGWLFARIIPNGEVHSCLKAHRIPTGSLYANRFSEIWNSEKQKYFRKKTLVCEKSDPFFKLIGNDSNTKEAGCYKSCDDIGRNTWMHNRLKMLSFPEKFLLKILANILRIVRKISPKNSNNYLGHYRDPVIAGVIHGRKAFTGPEQVVIDITNRCNLRCISCWLYSPLLNKNKPSKEWLKKELPKDALYRLIDDLASLGTKKIRFTGGGEPFMHKDLMEIVGFAKRKRLEVAITTNFGLLSRKQIKELIDLGIEELCVSIWASNPQVYAKVHPGSPAVYYEKIIENLTYLKDIRKHVTHLTFANVIMSNNFQDFDGMYEMGTRYKADAIYFTLVDTFSGQTDALLLSAGEREQLLRKAHEIKKRSKDDDICLEFFDGFLRRLSMPDEDFSNGEYDKLAINKIPCYVGWIFARILADGSVAPCCRGVKKIMGNINKKSFKDIWFSNKYNEFRSKAKYLTKESGYFKEIGCLKECDNLMHNQEAHKKLGNLTKNAQGK